MMWKRAVAAAALGVVVVSPVAAAPDRNEPIAPVLQGLGDLHMRVTTTVPEVPHLVNGHLVSW